MAQAGDRKPACSAHSPQGTGECGGGQASWFLTDTPLHPGATATRKTWSSVRAGLQPPVPRSLAEWQVEAQQSAGGGGAGSL